MYLPDRGPETVAQVQRHEAAEDSVESPWAVHQDTIVSDGVPWQHLNLLSLGHPAHAS